MKNTYLIVCILLALVLAACAPAPTPAPTSAPVDNQATIDASVAATLAAMPAPTQAPTQPPAPTEPPTAVPTTPPTAAPTTPPPAAVVEPNYTPALTGAVWQWVSSQDGANVTTVTDPSRYQVQFNVDGTLAIQADCNSIQSGYTVGEGNTMTILPGASTMMACPPDSQADAFMAQLGATATYGFLNGALVLTQADPSKSMTLQMLPVAILPTPEPNTPSAQANTGVNVRSGPGTEYTVYGVLPTGGQAQVVGKNADGTWWALNMPVSPTGSGWVSNDYVSVVNTSSVPVLPAPAVPAQVEPVAPSPADPQVSVLTPAYVRQGPGEAYPVYGTAQPGQVALVIGKSEDGYYWAVRVNPSLIPTGFAWIQASLVRASNVANVPVVAAPAAPDSVALPPPAAGAPMGTATTAVNLRSGPSTDYPVLGVAQPGQTGQITGISQDGAWWQVRVPTSVSADGLAWVSAAYVVAYDVTNVPVVAAPPPPQNIETTPPPSSPTGMWVITTEPLNVRAGPGNEYPAYGKIPAGVPLQVVGQSSNWLAVSMPALPGGIGWISGNYVVPYTGPYVTHY